MKKESISTVEGCPVNFLRLREHHASHPKWDPLMSSSGFLSGRLDLATNLYKRDLFAHYGCVNAIEFSQDGSLLISGGDDRRVLLWNLEKSISSKFPPVAMKEEHSSNIFCLGFDSKNRKIYSAGNDEQVIVHDIETGETLNAFMHEEAIYGVSVNPNVDTIFASAGEDGQVLLFDTRTPRTEEPLLLARSYDPFHAVQFHPAEPKFIVTANPKEGVVLWDIRKPRIPFLKYGDRKSPESSMCARFNSSGTQIIALRRRLPPILFNTQSASPVCQFDADHYYNSCTMKSCCFAGSRDQYVVSGSDDFNVYMWRIPDPGSKIRFVSEAHLVLKGHRSIVNQVRFNPRSFTIASSGVEKIIKLWSTVPVPGSNGTLESRGTSHSMTRRVYTHEEYIGLVLDSGQNVSHDYSHGNTTEDPRMMAFFDSLVQREVEGWTTNTDFSDLDSSSTPTYSSSTVPSTDESDNDGAQPRTALHSSSSSSTLPFRKRRILRTRKLRSSGRSKNSSLAPENLNENSDDEKPVAHAHPGSDWILKLIAKKRAQLKAAKKKRKNGKKKQKSNSHKFIRCLTSSSSRPRPYMYRPDNYRSVAMTRSSTSIGGELLRRRHIVAPYTVVALSSYADSDEEEDSDQSVSDDEDKSIVNDTKVTYKNNGNIAGESSSGPRQGTSKSSSSLKRKSVRLWSSESSSLSSDDDKEKIQFKGRKHIVTHPSKDRPNGNSVKKSRLTKLVSEAINSDSNDINLRNGAPNRVRKNKQRGDIDVSNGSNVPRATSDVCSEIVDLRQSCDINNINDAIPISGISMDKAGSVSFESNHTSANQNLDFCGVALDKPCSISVPGGHSSEEEIPISRSSQNAKASIFNNICNFYNTKNCSDSFESTECQSPLKEIEKKSPLQSANSSLVSCSFMVRKNSSRTLTTPQKNGLTNIFSQSESQLFDGFTAKSLNGIKSPRPDSGLCSSTEHTPDVSISLSDAHTPDSGISAVSLISNLDCSSLSSICTNIISVNEQIDDNNVKKVINSGEISFKKVSDLKVRKYRSRSSSDDIL